MTDFDRKKGLTYRINSKIDFYPSGNKLRYQDSGSTVRIEPLLSQVLTFLIERRSQPVTRAELQETFWSNDVFSDDALTKAISKIRKLLGSQSYIETLSKVGYEWIAHTEVIRHRKIKIPRLQHKLQLDAKAIWALILVAFILLIVRGIFFPHH